VKRAIAGVLVVAALATMTERAGADDSVPLAQPWGGSNIVAPQPITAPITQLHLEGRIQRGAGRSDSVAYARPVVAITLEDPDVPVEDAGCDTDGSATAARLGNATYGGTVTTGWKRYAYSADVPFAPTQNGDQNIYVCVDGKYDALDTHVPVRLPAPTVTNLVATAAGHKVNLAWDDMRGAAPDLAGYRVERSIGGGSFTAVQTVGPEAASFTDTTLPNGGGKADYQVVALRPFVADAAPSNASAATFAAAPAGSAAGGTGGTGAGGTGTGGTGGGGVAGGGGGAGRPGISSGTGIRVPRVGTPSRNFFPPLLAPPAIDTGFNEELPFDEAEPGEEALADSLADDSGSPLPGRGLAVPVAIGLVLAAWALHLRFLARASRPVYADPIEVLID
jgi:hypothetical protein